MPIFLLLLVAAVALPVVADGHADHPFPDRTAALVERYPSASWLGSSFATRAFDHEHVKISPAPRIQITRLTYWCMYPGFEDCSLPPRTEPLLNQYTAAGDDFFHGPWDLPTHIATDGVERQLAIRRAFEVWVIDDMHLRDSDGAPKVIVRAWLRGVLDRGNWSRRQDVYVVDGYLALYPSTRTHAADEPYEGADLAPPTPEILNVLFDSFCLGEAVEDALAREDTPMVPIKLYDCPVPDWDEPDSSDDALSTAESG